MFQTQNRDTINSIWKVAVSFKIIMMTSVTRSCFTKQHQTCKTKTKTIFWSQTGLVLRPTVSDHITDLCVCLCLCVCVGISLYASDYLSMCMCVGVVQPGQSVRSKWHGQRGSQHLQHHHKDQGLQQLRQVLAVLQQPVTVSLPGFNTITMTTLLSAINSLVICEWGQ